MKLKRIVAAILAICTIFTLSACSKKENPTDKKITVNGQVITVEEYNKTYADYKLMYENQYGTDIWKNEVEEGKTFEQYLEEMVLDTMVLEIVLMDEAKQKGIEVTQEAIDEEIKTYKGYFDNDEEKYKAFLKENNMTEDFLIETIKKELMIKEFLQIESASIDEIVPTEEELKQVYDEHKENFDKIRASHILVDTEEKAKEIKKKIDAGENFEELAKEYSTCPSAEKGGDLDYFTRSEMVAEFSDVAFSMKVGEISEPVKSSYGYHIIKVTDIKDKYDDIDEEDAVYQLFKTLKYNEMLDNFIAGAKIEK